MRPRACWACWAFWVGAELARRTDSLAGGAWCRLQGCSPPSPDVQVCKVIRWLMARNPAQRPTAKEVLRSDLLPATGGWGGGLTGVGGWKRDGRFAQNNGGQFVGRPASAPPQQQGLPNAVMSLQRLRLAWSAGALKHLPLLPRPCSGGRAAARPHPLPPRQPRHLRPGGGCRVQPGTRQRDGRGGRGGGRAGTGAGATRAAVVQGVGRGLKGHSPQIFSLSGAMRRRVGVYLKTLGRHEPTHQSSPLAPTHPPTCAHTHTTTPPTPTHTHTYTHNDPTHFLQMAARDHIVECVTEVFGRHGAVPMCSLDVGFATADDPKGAMQVCAMGPGVCVCVGGVGDMW